MSGPLAAHRSQLDTLRAAILGDVIGQGDAGYDAARQAFELAVDQNPAVVAFAESAADVAKIVSFARSVGLRVAPQCAGHGASPLEHLEHGILLKTSRMRRVDIDPASRTARVEAGAQWQDATVPAGDHGLAALAGTSPNVGVVGYTLGGGIGWHARRHGLCANSVTAVEIVTPDGRLVRADSTSGPDLLWAVRGGGGSVGVVTAIEISLYPVRELYAGVLFFPVERAGEILHAWRGWTDTVPDEVTSVARILRFPPIPDVPEPLRGRSFALVEAAYVGDDLEGAELIRPLRGLGPAIDTFAMVRPSDLGSLHMDPPEPVPGVGDGMLLTDASAAAIDAMLAAVGPGSGSSLPEHRAASSRRGSGRGQGRRPPTKGRCQVSDVRWRSGHDA
jgi:FAD/FMN-containing dehydrogenase